MKCVMCKKKLTGKQKKFCSTYCKQRYYRNIKYAKKSITKLWQYFFSYLCKQLYEKKQNSFNHKDLIRAFCKRFINNNYKEKYVLYHHRFSGIISILKINNKIIKLKSSNRGNFYRIDSNLINEVYMRAYQSKFKFTISKNKSDKGRLNHKNMLWIPINQIDNYSISFVGKADKVDSHFRQLYNEVK